ncbi:MULTISPECIES: protein translocase subunit SecF [unclassified Nitratiruptor]|uniref:protein translocase subunit SecF n=1 Tax=unclassified Nitratiruptor TaxID=2624044 RepID=UPI0019152F06|nr:MULTISPECIES: protein translocase subunit SecF [unclassified Nitratiruptor]BCD60767.1 preprotein translocase subunit SecF [Nitratiruptor sp. YY08-10]BCD64699.1 preprotein translocase subunit SecF [Nitratiruptor sp. YY08-14]
MEFFKTDKIYNFMGKAKLFMAISAILVLGSWALVAFKGLNFGIDFAGGTIVQVRYDKPVDIAAIRKALKKSEIFQDATVTKFGSDNEIVIRIKSSTKNLKKDIGDEARAVLKGTGNFEIRRVDMVGPKVGGELREKGLMATVIAILGILIYVSIRFEWRFALASVLALVHDVSIAMGAISLFNVPVNLDILAAILTILGYSLNDTIIVFDRIREGIVESVKLKDLNAVINESITKTLSRTTLTSLTTFFVVLTLYLFGGEIIKGFSFTLLVGIVVGTYSSIFIASPMLTILGFDLQKYRAKLAEKRKKQQEKERMRAMYEQGMV